MANNGTLNENIVYHLEDIHVYEAPQVREDTEDSLESKSSEILKNVDNNNKTGRGKKDFEFANEMNDILAKKRNVFPELLLSTGTVIHLQDEQKDNNNEITEILNEEESPSNISVATDSALPARVRKLRRQPTRKLKRDTLQEMRKDREEYYVKRLK
ncbi:hypothetical protein CBL_08479 [Carabus blaptoides fortunei]